MTTPYRYLIGPGDDAGAALVDDLCRWHDRMVAHVRRHGASGRCRCGDPDDCPQVEARELWGRATREFGVAAAPLTFLRQHGSDAHG